MISLELTKSSLDQWLNHYPKMKEIYWFKEALYQLYQTKGFNKASVALINLTDRMALSSLEEIKKLRKTFAAAKIIFPYFTKHPLFFEL